MKNRTKLERKFQPELKEEIEAMFEGCIVTKLNSGYIQGIPDLLILFENKWATLECKTESSSKRRPNQPYYVDLMNKMSFSRFVCPENKDEVLGELQDYFLGGELNEF